MSGERERKKGHVDYIPLMEGMVDEELEESL